MFSTHNSNQRSNQKKEKKNPKTTEHYCLLIMNKISNQNKKVIKVFKSEGFF